MPAGLARTRLLQADFVRACLADPAAKRYGLMTLIGRVRQWSRLILASLLFAVALVRADGPIRLTAILPGVPAVLAVGLGDGERAVS